MSRAIPQSLADVALIDAATCAAVGDMSVSWWHQMVQEGQAPQPVIRQPRCTRWAIADVRTFWQQRATQAQRDAVAAAAVTAQAKKASKAAHAKRATATTNAGQ